MDWDRIYGVQEFAVFVILAHVPLIVETPLSAATLAVWYVAMVSVAVLTLATTVGWPALAREYEAEFGALAVFCCGVGCAVATVVLFRAPEPTTYTYGLAGVAGVAAVVLVAVALRPVVTAWIGR
jgi:hypothetical protein